MFIDWMRTERIIVLMGLTAMIAVAPAAASSSAAPKPKLAATLVECATGSSPTATSATFEGSMPAIARASRMAMRFTLYQRLAKGGFQPVAVPDWRTWVRSVPGRPGFVVQRRIDSLVVPARYKAIIEFRWTNAKGKILRSKSIATKVCKQPQPVTPLQ